MSKKGHPWFPWLALVHYLKKERVPMYFEAVFNPSSSQTYSTDAQNLSGKKIAIQAGWVIKEGQFKGQECYYIPNSTIGLIPVCDLEELKPLPFVKWRELLSQLGF